MTDDIEVEKAIVVSDDSQTRASEQPESPQQATKPYSAFTKAQKWTIVIICALGATSSPISSNIYVPAIPVLVDAFHVSSEKINLTVTVYLIFQAITPAFWGAAADTYGRRPIFILEIFIFLLACIGTALCPTNAYWLLILMRIVQATGASATIAVGAGVISDIARPQERGRFIGAFNLTSTLGPAMGPLLGGVFAYTLGWRSIFWFLAIVGGVVLVATVLFLPETLRALVDNGSVPPPLLNCTPVQMGRRLKEKKLGQSAGETQAAVHMPPPKKYQPLTSFIILGQPDILLLFIWSSLYYTLYYCVLTIFSTLLDEIYHFSVIIIGVCYISNGAGVAIGGIGTGLLMDKQYKKEKARVGGDHHTVAEFRLEKVRFALFPYHVALMIGSSIALGWTMHYQVHIAVPLILNFVFGIGTGFLTGTTIYGIDLLSGKGSAVTASFNFTRCLVAAVFVGTIQIINRNLGSGWTFVLVNGICVAASPLLFVVMRHGPRWRARRAKRIADSA